MPTMYEEARLVARYVLTPSSLKEDREDHDQLHSTDCEPQCVDPATGTSTGTPVEWSTTFLEKVAPAIRRGYSYITETCKHEIDMIGFAKILVDDFSEENFFTITNMIATEDISQLNWGRIIAFFTFLSFVAADLAKKERHADIETLEQWLVKFLSRKDILGWIADRGGWVSIGSTPSRDQETGSWWQSMLQPFNNFISQLLQRQEQSVDDRRLAERERDMAVREKAVAEREKEVYQQQQRNGQRHLDMLDEKVGRNTDLLLENHRQMEGRVGDNADRQLQLLKAAHDGQRAQDERFNYIDGEIVQGQQQDRAEHQKTRREIRSLAKGRQDCEEHQKTRAQVKELADEVAALTQALSKRPIPVEEAPPDHDIYS